MLFSVILNSAKITQCGSHLVVSYKGVSICTSLLAVLLSVLCFVIDKYSKNQCDVRLGYMATHFFLDSDLHEEMFFALLFYSLLQSSGNWPFGEGVFEFP